MLIHETDLGKLHKAGIKDSKTLTYKQIRKCYKVIKKTAIKIVTQKINAKSINTRNLNDLEMEATVNIINDCYYLMLINRGTVFIDNWEYSEGTFWNRFNKIAHKAKFNKNSFKFIIEHECDSTHIACMCAGIVSKYHSIKELDFLRQKYGDFGSGNVNDKKTLEWVRNNPHLPIIRTKWKTYKKLFKEERQ